MLMSYAGIGNREIPEEVGNEARELAGSFSNLGLKLRTGGAQGADEVFYEGHKDRRTKKLFLPCPQFRNLKVDTWVQQYPSRLATLLAEHIHPHWHTMTSESRAKMARNLDILADFKQVEDQPAKVKLCEASKWLMVDPVAIVACCERTGATSLSLYRKGGTNFGLYALHVLEKTGLITVRPAVFNLFDAVAGYEALEYAKALVASHHAGAVKVLQKG